MFGLGAQKKTTASTKAAFPQLLLWHFETINLYTTRTRKRNMAQAGSDPFSEEKKEDDTDYHQARRMSDSLTSPEVRGWKKASSVESESVAENMSGYPRRSTLESKNLELEFSKGIDNEEIGRSSWAARSLGHLVRTLLCDLPLLVVFTLYVGTVLLHKIHDEYMLPQLRLMRFIPDARDFTDTTYYHRRCDPDDVTATSVNDLVVPKNASTEDSMNHMLKHGVSVYPDLVSTETAWELRNFIAEENPKHEGWYVIQNAHRYSWGIDVNMHPSLRKFWKELGSNKRLVNALTAIVGPDPAIIEFTAITAAYGAKDQHDHQDVVPPGSGAKFARTFVPSYSLFITLQDTSYDMGATHVCPGSHLCSENCEEYCPDHNLAMSGDDVWPQGWGALVNQQTTHKGMGHFKKGGLDRVVIIATFAPRPETRRALETRMIAQGGSYSLWWSQWGHTLSDFVYSESRMTEPQKTLRSLGLISGRGWDWISVVAMRMANGDNGYDDRGTVEDFLGKGGYWFLPTRWHMHSDTEQALESKKENVRLSLFLDSVGAAARQIEGVLPSSLLRMLRLNTMEDGAEDFQENGWYTFLFSTLKRTNQGLRGIYLVFMFSYIAAIFLIDMLLWSGGYKGSYTARGVRRLLLIQTPIVLVSYLTLHHLSETNWAKDIKSGKAYRLPAIPTENRETLPLATLPNKLDVLMVPSYASNYMASYSLVVDAAHPGNVFWKDQVRKYSKGYADLSPSLKRSFCHSLPKWIQTERRFLAQDRERHWSTVWDEELLSSFCRKALVMDSNRLTTALVRQLDSNTADSKFGRWHDTAMQRSTIREYLEYWHDVFVPPLATEESTSKVSLLESTMKMTKKRSSVGVFTSSVKKPQTVPPTKRRFSLPPVPPMMEPFHGAWLQEGDVVEAMFNCKFDEWYRGTIVEAVPNESYFDIQYDDGEVDEGMLPRCVRRFVPYKLDELVEIRIEDEYVRGRIVEVEDDDQYSVKLENGDGHIFKSVPTGEIRRFTLEKEESDSQLRVGSLVWARYQGGSEWFSGTVVAIHKNNHVAVQYDDGDYEGYLSIEYIRLRPAI